eukprot:2947984-Ditylum_brightwellii.AAC.1
MQPEGKVQSNAFCYNTIINKWTRNGKRSQDNIITTRHVVRLLSQMDGKQTRSISIRPDVVSYTNAYTTLANNGKNKGEGAERAGAILSRMETTTNKKDNLYVCPNTIAYNAVLDTGCKSGDCWALEKADALLCKMEKQYQSDMTFVKPDIISFNTLIHAYSKSTETDTVQTAENILMNMEQHEKMGKMGGVQIALVTTHFSHAIVLY